MRILVSSCLLGKKCAYDGEDRYDPDVASLSRYCEFVAFCPELAGGLGCPRERHEISGGSSSDVLSGKARIISQNGIDHTHQFLTGALKTLDKAIQNDIKYAVLKSKSPSCGKYIVHSGDFDGRLKEGKGLTSELLAVNNISIYNEEEISALKIRLQML